MAMNYILLTNIAKKVDWTARQLDRMAADLIGFQEVFHEQALAAVLAATDRAQAHQLVMAEGIGQGPGVALATQLPVLGHRIYIDFPEESWLSVDAEKARIPLTSFSHPVLAVDVELPNGMNCSVFVVHLKSKRPMLPRNADRSDPVELAKGQARSLIRRAAEATALRFILMEKLRDRRYPVIVMGDVNDNHTSVTTQLVTGQPPLGMLALPSKAPRLGYPAVSGQRYSGAAGLRRPLLHPHPQWALRQPRPHHGQRRICPPQPQPHWPGDLRLGLQRPPV